MIKTSEKNTTKVKSLVEIVKIILISLAIILPIRFFVFQPFIVRGDSMEPSFSDGQYLIVDEISYRFHEPRRGDVIIFKYPKDPSQYYIKRVIGLPKETVEIKEGHVKIYNSKHATGVDVDENYLPKNLKTPGIVKVELDDNNYFVMGDNRRASSDSRIWGSLPKDKLIGRVWLRGLPLAKAASFSSPSYNNINN